MAGQGLYARLRADAGAGWATYVDHPFVRALGAGTLAEAAFRRYLVQDYLFLIDFARAYALAVFKADDLDTMRRLSGHVRAILDVEMGLHVAYCRRWGIDEAALVASEPATETLAYTRYVLERGLAGDLLDLLVALAPCIVGYGEIGARLAADPATRHADNPYGAWIEMYAGAEYQELAAESVAMLDGLAGRVAAPGRYPALLGTFRRATMLEAALWQMGLAAAE